MQKHRTSIKRHLYKLPLLLVCLILAGVSLVPMLVPGHASAYGQIALRSLTLSSGVPSATNVSYKFTFTLASTTQVEGLKFKACTTAVGTYPTGTCTAPTGMTGAGNGFSNAAFGSQSGWQGATNFAVDNTGANDCIPSPNILCAKRVDTTSQTTTSRTITFTTIKNPSVANTAFYVGIYTYSGLTGNYQVADFLDFGATASAVVQTLTTSAAVAEVLNFCVGSTSVDDTVTSVATDCSTVAGTSVNIGTLDTSTINVSPVAVNGGDGNNGVAMVRTNALNGLAIYYDAIQQSGSNHLGTMRISGATCDDPSGTGTPSNGINGTNDQTDKCINAAGITQTTFTAGQEKFGMTIAGVNRGSTNAYSCDYGYTVPTPTGSQTPIAAGNNCSLMPSTNYLGKGTNTSDADYGTDNGFAWDETGTAEQIAGATTAVDDEALILKFAATPQITTPFGPYSAKSDYIAVPTY